jgi:DNA-binding NtrC family response regulator
MAERARADGLEQIDLFERWFEEFLSQLGPQQAGPPPLRTWLEAAEAWRIARALGDCRGNRSAAARALGIGRRTLYAKMEKLGIEAVWSSRWTPRRSEAAPLGAAGVGLPNQD